MLDILPSRVGKLPNEPDWDRYFGLELEFVPQDRVMLDYRLALYKHGIDTLDDSCAVLNHTRQNYALGPGRFYDPLRCGRGTGCMGRGTHIYATFVGGARKAQLDFAPRELLEQLRAKRPGWAALDLNTILTGAWGVAGANDIKAVLVDVFPRIESVQRRHWNLGTDPSAGLELRTIPLRGGDGWDAVKRACAAITEAGGDVNDNCGGHVHIDMTHEDAKVCGRTLLVYRMVEPLMAAPVNPTRYYERAYNPPSWRNRLLKSNEAKMVLVNKDSVTAHHTRWLATQQIRSHGTFEFRGLEGTLDPRVWKSYALILNRFVQAAKLGGDWGVRIKNAPSIGVDGESVKAFLAYLDLDRKDLCDDLKDSRDWYLERVKEFESREAFQGHLVVGKGSELGHASLTELRKDGKHKSLVMFEPIQKAVERRPDKEWGLFVQKVIEKIVASSTPPTRMGAAGRDLVPEDVYASLPEAWHRGGFGGIDWEIEDDEFTRNYRWLYEDRTLYDEFVTALTEYDFERLGKWWVENVLDPEGNARVERCAGMAFALTTWLGTWARAYPTRNQIEEAFQGGDASCVDF